MIGASDMDAPFYCFYLRSLVSHCNCLFTFVQKQLYSVLDPFTSNIRSNLTIQERRHLFQYNAFHLTQFLRHDKGMIP